MHSLRGTLKISLVLAESLRRALREGPQRAAVIDDKEIEQYIEMARA